jgi:formate-dependent phosphoribosylglycinamide formyltransferase (GAR transformylase)
MHVLFVEPSFPSNQREFVRALASVGARVTGIGEAPPHAIPEQTRQHLDAYEQVPSVVHEESMVDAVRRVQRREWVDRLEATVEAHILPAARVRETCGIPGTTVETAYLCRDKPAMKAFLRRQGIPCAQSDRVRSGDEARAFAARVGFPLILKPTAGAGAAGTERVDDESGLERAMRSQGLLDGAELAIEEFVEGHEAFYDTITIGGTIAHEFVSHYYPRVLDAMRTRAVNPYFIATNRVGSDSYREVKELGRRVVEAMGIGTSATHMEWFFGPKGLKFSEIGCRPPGVGAWDLYCAANDIDVYREWAMGIVHGRPEALPSRRYSAAILNLRPERDGRIAGYDGLDEVHRRVGEWIIDVHLPPPGTGTQGVEAGYMANAWIRLKHPDYDTLREILEWVGRTIHVRVQ